MDDTGFREFFLPCTCRNLYMNPGLCFIRTNVHLTRWWFQIFFIFTPTWGDHPIWLIFFKWVETTNQLKFIVVSFHVSRWCYREFLIFGNFLFHPASKAYGNFRQTTREWPAAAPKIILIYPKTPGLILRYLEDGIVRSQKKTLYREGFRFGL